ncbi:MAG: RecQ family ATP-dependent DNA helicase [Opitutales bacterium]|nr:RecQ family ATP-dependent DNA helicase [Opitutales bacterium]MCH8541710.1 RecQ family ATP-dependent DNA helicase [Opitutales bacterium]
MNSSTENNPSDLSSPAELLSRTFGFSSFRPGQEQVIDTLLAGRSAAAIFPTGSGKSLCYQLPALLLPGLTLVVSPLLALMKDQIDALRKRGVAAERLDSSLDEEEYRAVLEAIRGNQLKLLFVAPERLSNERFLNLIRTCRISLLAVDEAHCISSWGHNFRPDYLKLARAVEELQVERVLALTATATPQVATDMAAAFKIAEGDVVNTGFYRPNLELRVTACTDKERPGLLLERLRARPPGPTIVYVTLQKQAEDVADRLTEAGFQAKPYHAGLKSEVRQRTQEAFMAGEVPIICATIAFGMGIDKADIRYIYHYHLPKGYESYMQEIGRAGRDGERSVCELLACAQDRIVLENFVYGDTPDPENLRDLVKELLQGDPAIDLSVHEISRRFDIRNLVVNTLLTRLELLGVIRAEGPYYADIRFAPKCSSKEMLSHYPDAQKNFLQTLFRCCRKAQKWITLDMEAAQAQTGQDRGVVLRALQSLETKGLVDLQMAGYRLRYRRLEEQPDLEALADRLGGIFAEHERREIERIDRILDYAASETCLTAKLLAYFGETIEPCGHCGLCLGDPPAKGQPADESLEVEIPSRFSELVQENPTALARPRQQARFLCGITSPAVSAVRGLRGNPLFGTLSNRPFEKVLQACGG